MAAKKKGQNVVVWILMALLIAGLAGFGVDGFLSGRATSIGTVGTRDISTQAYLRALQDAMRQAEREGGQPMPLSRALELGLDARVRAQLVTQAALDSEADRIGISVGDATVMQTVTSIDAFRGPGGAFDREIYRLTLDSAGLTPARFEADIRRESARGILQAATAAGVQVPEALRGAILDHFSTPRSVTIFTLDETALEAPLDAPDEAAIAAYHRDNIDRFTRPELRSITYAWVRPDMLLDTIEVDPAAIEALYDAREAEFRQPERRLVERLVFPDEAEAGAAMTRLAEGASFEDLVEARGLSLDDVDMGDVTEAQLGAAGAPVFALSAPGDVTGPHRTALGPAIFRMNAILAAQEIPLAEAAEELRIELAQDAARRRISDDLDLIEDLLAGGATLEDLAAETDMELGQIDWFPGIDAGIAGYAEFREAARAAAEGDFPQALALSDGGLFALRLDGITPPTPQELDEVRTEAEAGARQQALEAALAARAEALAVDLVAQGIDAFSEATGLVGTDMAGITRLDFLPGMPQQLLTDIHAADAGATVQAAAGGQVWLAKITEVGAPDPEDTQTARLLEAIDTEIGGGMAQDLFGYFARALEGDAGFRFNDAAIQAVHDALR